MTMELKPMRPPLGICNERCERQLYDTRKDKDENKDIRCSIAKSRRRSMSSDP